jgi:predicted GIY-YIG superfamily endonuclease
MDNIPPTDELGVGEQHSLSRPQTPIPITKLRIISRKLDNPSVIISRTNDQEEQTTSTNPAIIEKVPSTLSPVITNCHKCYILRSKTVAKPYVGYTVDFSRRIRQHNGEIVGGAKKTSKGRPWYPICVINGFYESSCARRFEYRLQHPGRKKKGQCYIQFIVDALAKLIRMGDGSVKKQNRMPWPPLMIDWYPFQGDRSPYQINLSTVTNNYIM